MHRTNQPHPASAIAPANQPQTSQATTSIALTDADTIAIGKALHLNIADMRRSLAYASNLRDSSENTEYWKTKLQEATAALQKIQAIRDAS